MQTAGQEHLQSEGNKRFVRTQTLPAVRGNILDRNGASLALSAPVKSLYVSPLSFAQMPSAIQLANLSHQLGVPADELQQALEQGNNNFIKKYRLTTQQIDLLAQSVVVLPDDEQLAKIAQLSGMEVGKLKEQLLRIDRDFVYLKRHLPIEVADEIAQLGIKGLAFQQETKRHYPMGNLFAQIVGFTNIDGQGQEGLELAHDKMLHGVDGSRVVLRDSKGNIVDNLDSPHNVNPQDGETLQLALDQRIQSIAYTELNKAVTYHQAKAGSAIVLDAKTGEILAMVNSPSFDPNNPADAKPEHRKNRSVSDMIEPGSTMKPFPVAKALDDKKIGIHSWFNTESFKIGPATVKDTHPYPSLDVRGIIQKSSNVGTSKISALYQPKELYDFYRELGIGSRTRAGLSGETAGRLRNWETWKPIEQATMSFGYGLQMSLLQLARAYTVFTADGKLMPVSIKKQNTPPRGEQVISPETAKAMREIMVSVTEKGGTGTRGAVEGFDVAAKTGTAQKLVNKRYVNNLHSATFVGFAPAQNPRVIVAVNIDEPRANGYYGGVVAGPVFQSIMKGSLNLLGVPPTKPIDEKASTESK